MSDTELLNALVCIVFQDHFDAINAIWERDGGSPRTATETWLAGLTNGCGCPDKTKDGGDE